MSTATTRKPRKVTEPKGVCNLHLTINGTKYRVRGSKAQAFGATSRAFVLTKVGGSESYEVADTALGAACDCPSMRYSSIDNPTFRCKHLRALAALGIIRS
jgi:predicted nucleic acid-binding Zn finger protein